MYIIESKLENEKIELKENTYKCWLEIIPEVKILEEKVLDHYSLCIYELLRTFSSISICYEPFYFNKIRHNKNLYVWNIYQAINVKDSILFKSFDQGKKIGEIRIEVDFV